MTQRAYVGRPLATASSKVVIRQAQSTRDVPPVQKSAVVVLTGLPSQWKLLQPLTLRYELDTDGTHLVSDALFAVYGLGGTFVEAFQDYVASLIDFYSLLADSVTDEASARQFVHAQQFIQPPS